MNEDIVYVGYGITVMVEKILVHVAQQQFHIGHMTTCSCTPMIQLARAIYVLVIQGGAALIEKSGGYVLVGVNSFGFDINGGQPTCEGPMQLPEQHELINTWILLSRTLEISTPMVVLVEVALAEVVLEEAVLVEAVLGEVVLENSPINNWKPPLADADYEEAQRPAPASSCATISTQNILWGWVCVLLVLSLVGVED